MIYLIAAISSNGTIGRNNGLPWCLPTDLRRFKQLTLGNTLILGRTTWEAIGSLPGRKTLVVGRNSYNSVAEALTHAQTDTFIAGGAGVYAEGLDHANELLITWVHGSIAGDTSMPTIDWSQWQLVQCTTHGRLPGHSHAFTFARYTRYTDGATGIVLACA